MRRYVLELVRWHTHRGDVGATVPHVGVTWQQGCMHCGGNVATTELHGDVAATMGPRVIEVG
jgi:hypothetical protein